VSGPVEGLTLADILELRAYERVRDDFRTRLIARKRLRRVAVGPIMTCVFESIDTIRFQIQEMARAEKIVSDEGIQTELDIYNRLLPAPGELSATLFIELTSTEDLRHWLPRLVGVETSVGLELGAGRAEGGPPVVWSTPESSHAQALTRESITPAVHYLRFCFTEAQVAQFAAGPVALVVRHSEYEARSELGEASRAELLGDLEGTTVPLPIG
jgi:hypothetical protein